MAESKAPQLHIGHRKRIKTRYLEKGLASLDDRDILELLLTYAIPRKDVYEIASRLVEKFGSVHDVLEADMCELTAKGGLTEHTAILLKLINDIRSAQFRLVDPKNVRLSSLGKAFEYCHRLLSRFSDEVIIQLFLAEDDRLMDVVQVTSGANDAVALPIESIVINSARTGVKRIIVAHNHPSGNAMPSVSDVMATNSLSRALRARGVELAEHIIVAGDKCTAMLHHQTVSMSEITQSVPWKDE